MSTDLPPIVVRRDELDEATVDAINDHLAKGGVAWSLSEATHPVPPSGPVTLPDGWRGVGYIIEDGS